MDKNGDLIFDVDEFTDTLREEPLDRWYEIGSVISIVDASLKEELSEESEYLILRVLKNGVECYRRGGVYAKIVKDGQIHVLPNGFFGLNVGDSIVCATANFYKYLTDEGILADALVSSSSNEWMNMLIRRISDQCQLKCGNLSAVTLRLND